MTVTSLAAGAGMLVGLGLALLLLQFLPSRPVLTHALDRLSVDRGAAHARDVGDADAGASNTLVAAAPSDELADTIGRWIQRRVPPWQHYPIPREQLAMLGVPVSRFLGQKVLFAILGLAAPALLSAAAYILQIPLPWSIPVGVSLLVGLAFSFFPDYNARDDAKSARNDFTGALGAYFEGYVLAREATNGIKQSLMIAAEAGDSWVFERLRDELERERFTGAPPWRMLNDLAQELAIPELADFAYSIRLASERGAAINESVRDQAASLRDAQLADARASAGRATERMSIPIAALALIFLVVLITPAMLRILSPGGS